MPNSFLSAVLQIREKLYWTLVQIWGIILIFLAKNVGKTGHLLAVEPIPLFADVWQKNMRKFKTHHVDLFNCALGDEEKEAVQMSIPIVNGVVRHGLTQVNENPGGGEAYLNFEVPMKRGDQLLNSAIDQRLAFIKCDVEGYEQYVIPSLESTISKHHPILQIELGGEENKANVVDFLLNLCYKVFILKGEKLIPIQKKDIFSVAQDFYFIHENELEHKQHLIHN